MVKKDMLKLVSLAVFALSFSVSTIAEAELAGCDSKIMQMMKDQAEAKVAYDVARIDQSMVKPKSLLELTCFGKAAAASANTSSKIMSGDYMKESKQFINAAQESYGATGSDASESASADPEDCKKLGEMVDDYETGERKQLPSFEDVVGGDTGSNLPSDSNFKKSANNSQSTFNKVKTNKDTLNSNISEVTFQGNETPCEVLLKGGVSVSCSN